MLLSEPDIPFSLEWGCLVCEGGGGTRNEVPGTPRAPSVWGGGVVVLSRGVVWSVGCGRGREANGRTGVRRSSRMLCSVDSFSKVRVSVWARMKSWVVDCGESRESLVLQGEECINVIEWGCRWFFGLADGKSGVNSYYAISMVAVGYTTVSLLVVFRIFR